MRLLDQADRDQKRMLQPSHERRGRRGTAASIVLAATLLLSVIQATAVTPAVNKSPSSTASDAQQAQEQAGWADREAERRATDGDYDGAVQAEREAESDRQSADRLRHGDSTIR